MFYCLHFLSKILKFCIFHSKVKTLHLSSLRSRMFLRTIGKQKSAVSYFLKAYFTSFRIINQKVKPFEQKIVIDFKKLNNPTKVPLVPCHSQTSPLIPDESSKITDDTIQLLQRLSLVDLDSKEALKILQDSIDFANQIINIDTEGVEPLYTVLENTNLELREDAITDGNIRDDILRNAKVTEEEYFVAPPGNIPLEQTEHVLKSSGFVDFQAVEEQNVKGLKLTQLGGLVTENICQAWLGADHNNSIFRHQSREGTADGQFSFLNTEFQQNFEWIKQNFHKELPLVMLEEATCSAPPYIRSTHNLPGLHFPTGSTLSQLYFIKQSEANQYYFKIQRQRKIWWMRYASNPGSLAISDTKDDDKIEAKQVEKVQLTNLNFKFGFGDVEAETMSLITMSPDENEGFRLRDPATGRKVMPAIIKTTISTEMASLIFLMDGVESSNDHILHINRKLAPFQICIYCLAEVDSVAKELQDLSQYVATILRKSNIRTLNLPKYNFTNDKVMLREITVADKLGVPYIIVLDDTSLKDGMLKLRNRETRISETIHLSDVPDYLLKIFCAA